jgi:hypothetical protein
VDGEEEVKRAHTDFRGVLVEQDGLIILESIGADRSESLVRPDGVEDVRELVGSERRHLRLDAKEGDGRGVDAVHERLRLTEI